MTKVHTLHFPEKEEEEEETPRQAKCKTEKVYDTLVVSSILGFSCE
jgi:hypothetical protein